MTNREALKTRLGEGVTIIVSILLAFALDSWWDTHRTSRAVDEGLMSVVEELHDAEGGLVERVSAYDRVDGYLVAVLDLLDSAPSGSAIAIPDTLMAAVLYTPTIDPPTGALEAFLESGLLVSVSDPVAQSHLAVLPSRYDDGKDDERDALNYTLATVRPLFERSLSASDFAAVLAQMDRYWSLFREGTAWVTPVTPVTLRATPEIRNSIASRLQMLRTSRSEVEGLRESISGTLETLQ